MEVGKKAPAFTLIDDTGAKVSLKDFKGQKVILYFYPKDSTPGCTTEACDFRDNHPEFEKLNTVVIGISKDSQKSHQRFKEKNKLPFRLLVDEDIEVVQKYNVWQEKKMAGRTYMGIVRTTFLIDENGKIEKVYPKVKVKGHIDNILEYLKENN